MKAIAAFLVCAGLAVAQQATFYRGFSEVQQPLQLPANSYTWQPGEALWGSLVSGTLRLIGVNETTRQVRTQSAPPILAAYQGQKVSFFWNNQWQEATVVNAEIPLFMWDNRYLSSLPGPIAYPNPAGFGQKDRLEVLFGYRGQGSATLAYLTRGLSWGLRYSLEVGRSEDGTATGELTGWAVLNNSLSQTFNFSRVDLVAGSVPLLEGGLAAPVPMAAPMARSSLSMDAAVGAEYLGESSGVYRYRLAGAVQLEPGQTELPFLKTRLTPVFYWRYNGSFSGSSELRFERGYRIEAPDNLAGGIVTLRDGGVMVGQSSLGDVGKGLEARLSLGQDPEGRAERKVETLSQGRYRVTLTLRNPKTYPVEFEIGENFDSRGVLDFPNATRTPEGYRLRLTLRPGEVKVLTYALTLPTK